jgi:hypothetical protein
MTATFFSNLKHLKFKLVAMTKCVISPNKFPIVLFPQKHLGIVLVLKNKLRRLEQNMIFSAF